MYSFDYIEIIKVRSIVRYFLVCLFTCVALIFAHSYLFVGRVSPRLGRVGCITGENSGEKLTLWQLLWWSPFFRPPTVESNGRDVAVAQKLTGHEHNMLSKNYRNALEVFITMEYGCQAQVTVRRRCSPVAVTIAVTLPLVSLAGAVSSLSPATLLRQPFATARDYKPRALAMARIAGSGDYGPEGQWRCFRWHSHPPISDIVLSVAVEDVVVSAPVVAASNGRSSNNGD